MLEGRALRILIGERVKALRLEKQWSQESLAGSIGIKTDTLRHIEKGRNDPRIGSLSNLASALGIELSALISPEHHGFENIDNLFWQPELTIDLADSMTRKDMMMDRRSALMALTAIVISGPSLLDSLQGWLSPSDSVSKRLQLPQPSMGKLGIEEIGQLKQSVDSLYKWLVRFGGGPCRKAAVGLLNEVTVALREPQTPIIESELYRIMMELANTVATMTWHAGQERAAQNYYKLALRAAHANNDRLFGARVLAVGLSRQMMYQGKPQEALELVHFAQHGTQNIAGPQVKAMLYMREAWALSAMGQEAGFQRAVALSQESAARAKPDVEPEWVRLFCSDGGVAGITGAGHMELAKHNPCKYAEQACEQSLRTLAIRGKQVSRSSALNYINLAESRFLLKDTELAASYTRSAIDVSRHLQGYSREVRGRLSDLYKYTNQHTNSRAVQEVNAQMQTLLAGV